MIINNENLTLNDEDSLLDFIIELFKKDHSNSNLLENVLFCNVSEFKLRQLLNEIKVEYINDRVFQTICQRFFVNNKPINAKRYNKIKTIKEFKPNNEGEGILSYLMKKTGGNILDNGTIKLISNLKKGDHHSKNDRSSYVIVDFKDKSVQVSGYFIQSTSEETIHLKKWVIKGSVNGYEWDEIDRQSNELILNKSNNKIRFDIKKPHRKFYKYLNLCEIGEEFNLNYFDIAFIEIYGKIQEPKT